jgi:FKBP-type peptidyl-prolyl cis-trans isomerase (trigger factor)
LVQNSDVNNNQPVVKNDEVNKVQPAPENTTVSTGDPVVQDGDFIFLDYTARLEDGTVVDSTRLEDAKKIANYNPDVEYKPLSFTVGKEKMRAGFEKVVLGMKT